MDSNSPEILPPVHIGQTEALPSQDSAGRAARVEKGESSKGEQPGAAGHPAPSITTPIPAGVSLSPQQAAASSNAVSTVTHSLIADDTDLIEKQWVIKAKEIIDKTKNDPRLQNNEINKVRADYMYKRYGKEIKIPEE